jgi:serralysin
MAKLVVDSGSSLRMDAISAYDLGYGADAEHFTSLDASGFRVLSEIDYTGAVTSFDLKEVAVWYDDFLNWAEHDATDHTLASLFAGDDDFLGSYRDDYLEGFAGADILDGGAGADTLVGGGGSDLYYVDDASDLVVETAGSGTDWVYATTSYTLAAGSQVEGLAAAEASSRATLMLVGNALANTIIGNAGANTIQGGGGNDFLVGGGGNDSLSGGSGRDVFLFSSPLNRTGNVDRITDFNGAADTIELENAVFRGLKKTGYLNAAYFRIGIAAQDANDHIIYNKLAGTLSYDPDGSGGAAAVKFATVTPYLSLTAKDFYVV